MSEMLCFTNREFTWWRNLVDAKEVTMTLKRARIVATPTVLLDEPEAMKAALNAFLIAVPRDAEHAGVSLDGNGRLVQREVEQAIKRMVYISIELPQTGPS